MWRISCVIWISLLAGMASLQSQSLAETQALGLAALEREAYSQAESFLKRAAFFQQDSPRAQVQEALGRCYLNLGQPERALDYFDRAFFLYPDEPQAQTRNLLGKAQSLLEKSAYQEALLELYQAPPPKDKASRRRLKFYLGLSHFLSLDYKEAYQAWQPVISQDSLSQARLKQLLLDNPRLERPRPKTAELLSYFLPGLGQFYAGDLKNGLNSFLLNGALIALSVNVATSYGFLDAILSTVPWFQRYYLGGATKAGSIAEKQRAQNRHETLQSVLQLFTTSPGEASINADNAPAP